MAIIIRDNQPIKFNSPAYCGTHPDYFQLVDQTDTTQIQVEISPCLGSDQLITDPSFDVYPVTAWYSEAMTQTKRGEFCHEAGSWAEIGQDDVFETGTTYQVIVSVISINGTVKVQNGWELLGTITTTGDHIFTFTATNSIIKLRVEDGVTSYCISAINAYPINPDLLVAVRSYATDEIIQSFTLADEPDRFVFTKHTATISLPWADMEIPDGCYYISIDDACTNTCGQFGLFGEDLESESMWSAEGTGTLSSLAEGTMAVAVDNGQSITVTEQLTSFCAGKTYTVKLTLAGMSAVYHSFYATIGGTNSATFTTDGIKTFDITPASDGSFSVTFENAGAVQLLGSISGLQVTIDIADYTFAYDSEPITLGTFACTLLYNISNDNDAFGFIFVNSGFAPRIRVDGIIRNSTYPSTRRINNMADGTKQIYYGEQRKNKELAVEPVPEYVHDFLALGIVADHLFINGTEYHPEDDEPNISYTNAAEDWGSFLMMLSEKQQDRENRNAGNPQNPIDATQSFIVHPIKRLEILTEPSTQEEVIAL